MSVDLKIIILGDYQTARGIVFYDISHPMDV